MSLYARLAALAVLLLALAGIVWKVHHWDTARLAAADKGGYDRRDREQKDADALQSQANARETLRRLEAQDANQRKQNAELAQARDDAVRNAAAADGLREQNAGIARRWRDALGNSATVADREAAADAIGVLAHVLSRADKRAGILAAYADAARAAGLKCERDYDALISK